VFPNVGYLNTFI